MSKFLPVRFVDVHLEGQFWRERIETVLTRTIPSQHIQLGAHGILESLTLPNPPQPLRFPRNDHDFTVQVFWDSDVGKWIEAASYALSHRRDPDIETKIELALIRLYRLTGESKQLDLAAYFINERGRQPHYFDQEAVARGEDPKKFWAKSYEYNQSHKPVREQDKVVGHAVRAMYMYSAMADLAAELKDDSLKHACEVLWNDVMSSKIYITSGLGPAAANEGFTEDYDL